MYQVLYFTAGANLTEISTTDQLGDDAYNADLSLRGAKTVMELLIASGARAQTVTASGAGGYGRMPRPDQQGR